MNAFRALRADEVECRVAMVDKKGSSWVTLLLYKDARCDQNILDETVGPMNWQRHHSRENANCTVSIWDDNKQQWVEKEDTGTESNTEAQKGLASDSFKRACFNWGIGRELYTAPTIFVWAKEQGGAENFDLDAKGRVKADFYVSDMAVSEGKITSLTIRNRKKADKVVYTWNSGNKPYKRKKWREMTIEVLKDRGVNVKDAAAVKEFLPQSCASIPIDKSTTEEQWQFIYEALTA